MPLISHKNLIFIVLMFIVCCKRSIKQDVESIIINNVPVENDNDFYQEAKFFDIPIPLGIGPIKAEITSNAFAYFCNQQMVDLIKFYEEEMESFGWKKVSLFEGFESLLIYEKPNKHVSISIRPHINKNYCSKVNIFIMNKIEK